MDYAREEDRREAVELYDLAADIRERKNVAEKYPEKIRELEKLTAAIIEAE